MKRMFGLLAMVMITATVFAQATPQEKREVKNDLVKERHKRIDATKDVFRGEPARAKEDHRAAVGYHKAAVQKVQQVHRRNVRRKQHHTVHHRRHRKVHHRAVHH